MLNDRNLGIQINKDENFIQAVVDGMRVHKGQIREVLIAVEFRQLDGHVPSFLTFEQYFDGTFVVVDLEVVRMEVLVPHALGEHLPLVGEDPFMSVMEGLRNDHVDALMLHFF